MKVRPYVYFQLSDGSNGDGKQKGVNWGVIVGVGVGLAVFIEATRNFSIDNMIGRGGYGNMYKGYLSDGSGVAFKRFKNCSSVGYAHFKHEVEVIASVRHVNLVALRGYCTATTPSDGHQRIVKDCVRDGKGVAYFHYGAQPAIIHRDIKASNILLDDMFEAKVADFGLAKFTPEGMTHLTTRVAGTMGYVAPEYALYGQLTDRSDVYSFGVILLALTRKLWTLSKLACRSWGLMKNGSLHDHLFGPTKVRPSWPIRRKIALGTARGVAYFHYGAQPAIIHRDIKASNILLDDMFEAKVADFGLAKFTPEGMTHLTTRVAGTMGYVAPEYALADWAWSLVKNEKALDVIEAGMPKLGPPEVLEKYVLVAVLCSHPELRCRPSIDQVVKMLETDVSVPSIPERPHR
ncbi:putative LRR receptor-like serine/threonine-protein kinase RKF3 [Hibiscus syriacus]|uniref:non-specific serine/threonine protein kinase n=1 Tax=Hibiscus syriacus TaxID=106335 RepID=A0A6A2Z005_HIBSY|nr:putative LRR receptor-like serine/threonine-protein kinase RKF3 [Hibiscus syriacus]